MASPAACHPHHLSVGDPAQPLLLFPNPESLSNECPALYLVPVLSFPECGAAAALDRPASTRPLRRPGRRCRSQGGPAAVSHVAMTSSSSGAALAAHAQREPQRRPERTGRARRRPAARTRSGGAGGASRVSTIAAGVVQQTHGRGRRPREKTLRRVALTAGVGIAARGLRMSS